MSHELDVITATGNAAMIYRESGGTPWHRLGTPISEAQCRDLQLAIAAAGIDFEVEKVPHYVVRAAAEAGEPGSFFHPALGGWVHLIESKDGWSVIRPDRNIVIGTVGSVWEPLQNLDAWAPVSPILDEGLALIESGGSLKEGRQVWMLLRFDTDAILAKAKSLIGEGEGRCTAAEVKAMEEMFQAENGGGILPYGLLTNDHSGGGMGRLKETGVRVVCWNTLSMSLKDSEEGISIEVRHTKSVKQSWKEATEALFGNLVQRFLAMANYRAYMTATPLPDSVFIEKVLEATYPVRHLEEKIRRREGNPQTEAALRRKGEKRGRIRHLWEHGAGHTGDHSAWEAYQGAVEFLDHDDDAVPGADDNRLSSLLSGTLKRSKDKVFRGLLDYSRMSEDSRALVAEMLQHDTAEEAGDLLSAN